MNKSLKKKNILRWPGTEPRSTALKAADPYGSPENDQKRCCSYSRPIDGACNSPKTEKKRRSNQPKQCKKFSYTQKSVSVWTASQPDGSGF